jgi:hypothetical protein
MKTPHCFLVILLGFTFLFPSMPQELMVHQTKLLSDGSIQLRWQSETGAVYSRLLNKGLF